MADFAFADRYAENLLSPPAQQITLRQASAERIIAEPTTRHILDLAGLVFGEPNLELGWLRDEFQKEDAAFSLINNEQEARLLAAVMLGALIEEGESVAILAVATGSLAGRRQPERCSWLVPAAEAAFVRDAVKGRASAAVDTRLTPTVTQKLGDEVTALGANDWSSLTVLLGKIRSENQALAKTVANQATAALSALNRQVQLQREESQMLWWLVGGHSRALKRSFGDLGPAQAALAAGLDLASLASYTQLGPVAAPVMLERAVGAARKVRGSAATTLAAAVDGFSHVDLELLTLPQPSPSTWIAPVLGALGLARTLGTSNWSVRFRDLSGLNADLEIDPIDLAWQVYREHLLGQLL